MHGSAAVECCRCHVASMDSRFIRRFLVTCESLHCAGSFVGPHLKDRGAWRKPSVVEWLDSSPTNRLGARGFHSVGPFVLHLLGPPGAWPVKPGSFRSFSSFGVSSFLNAALKLEVNP